VEEEKDFPSRNVEKVKSRTGQKKLRIPQKTREGTIKSEKRKVRKPRGTKKNENGIKIRGSRQAGK